MKDALNMVKTFVALRPDVEGLNAGQVKVDTAQVEAMLDYIEKLEQIVEAGSQTVPFLLFCARSLKEGHLQPGHQRVLADGLENAAEVLTDSMVVTEGGLN